MILHNNIQSYFEPAKYAILFLPMKNLAFSTILQSIGLNEGESHLYELLLEQGALSARDLTGRSGIGRGNVYHGLKLLLQKGLVLEKEGKKTLYEPVDPNALGALLSARLQQARELEASFHTALQGMESAYKRTTGKPSIQIFQGWDGVKKALYDSLNSQTEILTYFDPSAMKGEIVRINRAYLKKRIERQIEKRILTSDTQTARAFFADQQTPFTSVGYLKDFPERHATGMEMYDGCISYLTLNDEKRISVIVRDRGMYDLHRQHFEYLWTMAQAANRSTDGTGSSSKTR